MGLQRCLVLDQRLESALADGLEIPAWAHLASGCYRLYTV